MNSLLKIFTSSAFCVMLCITPDLSKGQTNNCFPIQARIENGTIEGHYETKTTLQLYLGIPFAQPTVGELRWKTLRACEIGYCMGNMGLI